MFPATEQLGRLTISLSVLICAVCAPDQVSGQPLFDYRQISLDNGLQVITLEDFSCPIVAVQLWYHVGSKDEQPDRQGFAHMFEHMMFRGTDRLGPTDHFKLIRRTGGTCNAYTSFDQTVYVQTLPSNQLELALWLEAERMAFLTIDQESFDTERKVVEEERRLDLNEPYGTVFEKVLAKVFKVHPYRWSPIGNIPHLRAASLEELRHFWNTYYVPNNAALVIVGAVEHEEAQRLAKQYFGWLPRYPNPARVTVSEPPQKKGISITFAEENAPAPVVAMAFRTVPRAHTDVMAFRMLAEILGGGTSSRLHRSLVAEKRIAVAVRGATRFAEQDGVIVVGAQLPPQGGDTTKAMTALEVEIDRIRSEPVSELELTKVRNQLLRRIVTRNLNVSRKATLLGQTAILESDVSRVNTYLARVRAVTGDDLLRVAKRNLESKKATKVTVKQNLTKTTLKKQDEDKTKSPITQRVEEAASPGKLGLNRPKWFGDSPPIADRLEYDVKTDYPTHKLDNGLRVIVVPNHEVPFVNVDLRLLAGAWIDDKAGTADMTAKMLVKGTLNYSEAELAQELAIYAITLDGSANADVTDVRATCLSEHFARAVKFVAEVVLRPTFPEQELEKLRAKTLSDLAIMEKKSRFIANREWRRRLYGHHPYARHERGNSQSVESLTVADLKNWWSSNATPNRTILVISGDVTEGRALERVRQVLNDWQPSGRQLALDAEIPAPSETHIYLVDRPGSVQSQIRIGHVSMTRQHPNYFKTLVVTSYFGGAFSSRLMESLRVEGGLTYGVGGGYRPQRFSGTFSVRTFTKTASTAAAIRKVFDEFERLRTQPPSHDELTLVRSYFEGSFARQRETPKQIARDLMLMETETLPGSYFQSMLATVGTTRAQDCIGLVHETIDPTKMVIVVVGNASELEDDLSTIAPVTIVNNEKG